MPCGYVATAPPLGSRFPLVRFLFDRHTYSHALKKKRIQAHRMPFPCCRLALGGNSFFQHTDRPAEMPPAASRPHTHSPRTPRALTAYPPQNARSALAYGSRSLASCLLSRPPRLLPDYPNRRRADVPESLYCRHLRPLIAPLGRAPNQAV